MSSSSPQVPALSSPLSPAPETVKMSFEFCRQTRPFYTLEAGHGWYLLTLHYGGATAPEAWSDIQYLFSYVRLLLPAVLFAPHPAVLEAMLTGDPALPGITPESLAAMWRSELAEFVRLKALAAAPAKNAEIDKKAPEKRADTPAGDGKPAPAAAGMTAVSFGAPQDPGAESDAAEDAKRAKTGSELTDSKARRPPRTVTFALADAPGTADAGDPKEPRRPDGRNTILLPWKLAEPDDTALTTHFQTLVRQGRRSGGGPSFADPAKSGRAYNFIRSSTGIALSDADCELLRAALAPVQTAGWSPEAARDAEAALQRSRPI